MYHHKAILIGKNEHFLPEIRRELLNQSVEIEKEFPTIEAAVQSVNLERDESRLFVVFLEDVHQCEAMKHLHGIFAGRPILAIADGNTNTSLLLHIQRNGASQIVLLPLSPAEVKEALDSIMLQFNYSSNQTRIVAVTGAHGGVGSTSLAIDLAYEISQQFEVNTLLLELETHVGMLATFLRIDPRITMDRLVRLGHELDVYALKNAVYPFSDGLSVIAGPLAVHSAAPIESSFAAHLFECSTHLADVVVADVPATIDEAQLDVLRIADKVVVVAEQTIPSIKLTLDLLNLGLRSQAPTVVINRYSSGLAGFEKEHLQSLLQVEEMLTLSADDIGYHNARNQGVPLRLAAANSEVLSDLDEIASTILGKKQTVHQGIKHGFFHTLTSMLGV
jgi:pilus assembly protein CpaE